MSGAYEGLSLYQTCDAIFCVKKFALTVLLNLFSSNTSTRVIALLSMNRILTLFLFILFKVDLLFSILCMNYSQLFSNVFFSSFFPQFTSNLCNDSVIAILNIFKKIVFFYTNKSNKL